MYEYGDCNYLLGLDDSIELDELEQYTMCIQELKTNGEKEIILSDFIES